jgi:hypothetical protein
VIFEAKGSDLQNPALNRQGSNLQLTGKWLHTSLKSPSNKINELRMLAGAGYLRARGQITLVRD